MKPEIMTKNFRKKTYSEPYKYVVKVNLVKKCIQNCKKVTSSSGKQVLTFVTK